MVRIGIITKHSVPNYGAMLQAYGLVTHLKNLGHVAELVDYDQPATTAYFKPAWSFPPRINSHRRFWACKRFVARHQPRSNYHCNSVESFLKHADRYDLLFTGSDQVWFTGPVQYYDPMYFLDFALPQVQKASYAPSAGGIETFGEFEGKVKKALDNFSSLSVRDDNTERLLRDLGFDPTRVLDPTFLHDFHDLINQDSSPVSEPYLLIFGNLSGEAEARTKSKAEELGIKRIVSLQYNSNIATDRLAAPSPIVWLNYFFHASFVCTTYFHGSVFALKFKKPFVSIPTRGRVRKVTALLDDTGLRSQLAIEGKDGFSADLESAFRTEISWDRVEAQKNPKIDSSKAYIESAIARA